MALTGRPHSKKLLNTGCKNIRWRWHFGCVSQLSNMKSPKQELGHIWALASCCYTILGLLLRIHSFDHQLLIYCWTRQNFKSLWRPEELATTTAKMAEHSPTPSVPLEQEGKEEQSSNENQDNSIAGKDKDKSEELCHSEDDSDVEPPPSKKLRAMEASSPLPACKAAAGTFSHRWVRADHVHKPIYTLI